MKSAISALLGRQVTSMRRIGGGRNSRVYKLLAGNSEPFAAKVYFRHLLDKRNRLQVEYQSLQFLWKHGFRCISQPIGMDMERGFAVYEFIDGFKIVPKEVSTDDIEFAAHFLQRLEACKDKEDSKELPQASEACFSIQDIVAVIERRLARLLTVRHEALENEALYRFLKKEFVPTFETIKKWGKTRLDQSGMTLGSEVPSEEWVLSPSDFGFHNALRRKTDNIVFF